VGLLPLRRTLLRGLRAQHAVARQTHRRKRYRYRDGGLFLIVSVCVNSYNNVWYENTDGRYAWEEYLE
jgi:hypothetical protein